MEKTGEITFDEIRQIQKGNKPLFDRVMKLYKAKVAGLCFKYMRSAEDAADMAQEVFTTLYLTIDKFGFKSSFSTWIYRITVNSCLNRLKFAKRRRVLEQHPEPDTEEFKESAVERAADGKMLPDEEMEFKELKSLVMKELDLMSETEKNLFILLDMEGLSCEEIAGVLRMPVGTVKSRAARTREKLRKIIIRKAGDKIGLP